MTFPSLVSFAGRYVATDGDNQDDLNTLSGVAAGATHLGQFTGDTISDDQNNKQALQELETAVEDAVGVANLTNTPAASTVEVHSSTGTDTTLPAATTSLAGVMTGTDKTNLGASITLSGNAAGSTDNGEFSGATIPDDVTTKVALAALETAVELRGTDTTTMNIYTADDCSAVSGMVVGDLCFEY